MNPGFSATSILSPTLGIGANTAIFSVVNAVLIRPLPYPVPESLVGVFNSGVIQGETFNDDDVDLEEKLMEWETFYNCHRPHASLKGKTPYEILLEKLQSNPASIEVVSSTATPKSLIRPPSDHIQAATQYPTAEGKLTVVPDDESYG